MIEHSSNPLAEEYDGDIVVPAEAIDGKWQSNGSFDHIMSRPVDDLRDNIDDEIVDEPIKRRQRQQGLRAKSGFFATTKEELVRATGLNRPDIEQTIPGAAKYIAVIVQHQAQLDPKPDDPNAAGRAVTNEITKFAKSARGDRAALDYLAKIIGGDPEVLPSTSIDRISHLKGWEDDGLLARAVVDLKRLTELFEFVDGKGKDPLDSDYSLTDKETIKSLQKFVESLSVREAVDLIRLSNQQHTNQLKFWIEKIEQIEKFSTGAIKSIAKTALTNFGLKKPQ